MSEKKPDHRKVANVAPFGLRMLPDLKERVQEAAAGSGRSMNAEIVARLEHSLEGAFVDLSGVGFAALIMRLEATVEAYDHFMFFIRDELPGIDTVMVERGLTRQQAVQFIVSDWLREHGQTTPTKDAAAPVKRSKPKRVVEAVERSAEPTPSHAPNDISDRPRKLDL